MIRLPPHATPIRAEHVAEAIQYRLLDRSGMV